MEVVCTDEDLLELVMHDANALRLERLNVYTVYLSNYDYLHQNEKHVDIYNVLMLF